MGVMMSTPLRWSGVALVLASLLSLVACGGDGGTDTPPNTPGTPLPTQTATPDPNLPVPQLTELRVAYINLLSPVTTDTNNHVAADTFEQRLDAVIEELKVFKPDIVAFSEVFWTKELGSAQQKLISGLKMDVQYARANPWTRDQSKEESDQTAKLYGFDEGELVLVRAPLTILGATRHALNPRNSENEGRIVLHVSVSGPAPLGKMDVYVTHLTSDNERVREQQSADLLTFVKQTRGEGAAILLGDFNAQPGTTTTANLLAAGFTDVAVESTPAVTTCCRESIVGQQPPLAGRTDYIFSNRMSLPEVTLFASQPTKRADGVWIYPSDHNGLLAVFPVHPPPGEP